MNDKEALRQRITAAQRRMDELPARTIEYNNIAMALYDDSIDQAKLRQVVERLHRQAEELSLAGEG